ncbi:TIGR00645 family protein [Pasteurella oralis]|uniref:TIGR00645 family protein n=1 Tax=Pasteurella oralis TaxID=1071947 RepID=UPI000C7958CF|nr:TIGR00645 family protein [Pasteurella oralis]
MEQQSQQHPIKVKSQRYKPRQHHAPNIISQVIFASRWLQLPIYLGLIIVQGVYAYKFMKSLWELMTNLQSMDANMIMLAVLNLIDVVMIANLLVMVIVGGYEIFVSKLRTKDHPDEPEWLSHVNASVLKVKLSMSIISISSIHLLQTFVNAANMDEKTMMWQLFLHLGFLVSAVAMAYTDKILYSTSHKGH